MGAAYQSGQRERLKDWNAGRSWRSAITKDSSMNVSIIFVGELYDNGFNQCALEGVQKLQRNEDTGVVNVVSGIPYDTAAMAQALRDAAEHSDGVVFVGGQGNRVTPNVADTFPERVFAIVQGNVAGSNIASYDVLQEQSAFLAGVFAARMTRTGTVGHLSGHRVVPGLKGRAAFAAGIRFADKNVRLVSGFCGTQDDSAVTEAWTAAIAGEGADIIFTMLNAARDGATRACRMTGMHQIGNAADWCRADPEVFVASAMARIDLGVMRAISDMQSGFRPNEIVHLGIREEAVSLSMGQDVPQPVRQEIAALARKIAEGTVPVATSYDGPEIEFAA